MEIPTIIFKCEVFNGGDRCPDKAVKVYCSELCLYMGAKRRLCQTAIWSGGSRELGEASCSGTSPKLWIPGMGASSSRRYFTEHVAEDA
jgi:hypothetical protein